MKRHKQLRLAWVILALLSLFISAQASATSYDCDGGPNPVPASVSGSAVITSSGLCTIGHNVTATGAIYIMAGSIQAQGLQAGDYIQIDSTTGDVQVAGNLNAESFVYVGAHENIAINGDVTSTSDGSSRLRAGGNVSVNNITGSLNGHVIIETNLNQTGSGTFYIGGTGNANGINGTATSPYAVYVKNFSGDINVVDSSKIVAKAILLDASYGSNTIEIPAGTLSVSQYNDGTIQLLAQTVNFASGAVLSAQNSDSSGHSHGIAISAENINYQGDGLTLNADGDGSNGADGFVYFLANGGTIIALDEGNPYNPYIGINNVSELAAPINVSTTDNASLTLSANGSYSTVLVQGYPVVFSGGGDINFRAKGESHNGVYFRNLTTSDMDGFSFTGGSGSVTVDVSGKNGNSGGTAEITGGVASFDKASVNLKANGTTGVDGNAGSIWINVSKLLLNNTETVVTANGSNTGNGGHIELRPGTEALPVGQGPGKVRFEAKGGDASGNAGQVKIAGAAGLVTVYGATATSTPIDVSVIGTTGDGGTIDIQANAGLTFDGEDTVIAANSGSTSGKGGRVLLDISALTISANTNTRVVASGVGTGAGGEVNVKTQQNLSVANGVASLSIEARNSDPTFPWLAGDADGGTILITANNGSVDLFSGAIAVDGGRKGGTLDVKALNLTLDGNFSADGGAQGEGGFIRFDANSITLPETENTLITANGNGDGKGGIVHILANSSSLNLGLDNHTFKVLAKSNGLGGGGDVNITSGGDLTISGSAISTDAGPDGDGRGGSIKLKADSGSIFVAGTVSAIGNGQGAGGEIVLDASVTDLTNEDAMLLATQGNFATEGGTVDIKNPTSDNLFDVVEVIASFDSQIAIASAQFGKEYQLASRLTGESYGKLKIRREDVIYCNGSKNGNGRTWPIEFWDCGEAPPRAFMKEFSELIAPAIKAKFKDNRVAIFIFDYPATFNKLFGLENSASLDKAPDAAVGFTASLASSNTVNGIKFPVAIFMKNGLVRNDTRDEAKEIVLHELGHAVDIVENLRSSSADYRKIVLRDLFQLDHFVDSQGFSTGGRPPCGANGIGALEGVFDEVHNRFICQNNVLNSDSEYSYGSNKSNSRILNEANPKIFDSSKDKELHAQAFAYQFVKDDDQLQYWVAYTPNTVFYAGLLPCINKVAENEKIAVDPYQDLPVSGNCSLELPISLWQPYQ